jgi:putative transposase
MCSAKSLTSRRAGLLNYCRGIGSNRICERQPDRLICNRRGTRRGLTDWFSRRVLSWRLSITMEAAFCVETLEDALARHGKPDIFNTDQGSQFTGQAFTGVLANNEIAISMDGKGAWRDNVFVERLWRSVKYEEVYLRAYDSVSDARASIGRYLDFYNGRRPHSRLDGTTPDQAYFNPLPLRLAA